MILILFLPFMSSSIGTRSSKAPEHHSPEFSTICEGQGRRQHAGFSRKNGMRPEKTENRTRFLLTIQLSGLQCRPMAKNNALGLFEQTVLISVLALEPEAYGLAIQRKLTELYLGKDINLGSVYVTLERLEQRDCSARAWDRSPTGTGKRSPCNSGRLPTRWFWLLPYD